MGASPVSHTQSHSRSPPRSRAAVAGRGADRVAESVRADAQSKLRRGADTRSGSEERQTAVVFDGNRRYYVRKWGGACSGSAAYGGTIVVSQRRPGGLIPPNRAAHGRRRGSIPFGTEAGDADLPPATLGAACPTILRGVAVEFVNAETMSQRCIPRDPVGSH